MAIKNKKEKMKFYVALKTDAYQNLIVTTNLENMKKIIDFIKENKIKSVEINPMKKIERGE